MNVLDRASSSLPDHTRHFKKCEGIQQDHQADSWTGGHKVSSWVFQWAGRSEWLDIVEQACVQKPAPKV
jgi:hypothetical protein